MSGAKEEKASASEALLPPALTRSQVFCFLLGGNTRIRLRLYEARKQNSDVSLAARKLGRAPEINEGMNEGSQREYY